MKIIYIASPVTLYDTPAYIDIEQLVKRLYPEDTLLFAKGKYPSSVDWRREWPRLCPTVNLCIHWFHPQCSRFCQIGSTHAWV
jgi:hypothetical protein